MEYSIKELSRLSGVTTRTLRWYDEIGLLKPGRVAENGYRYYGQEQVDRLQDILFYRALGVELAQIKGCLDDPSYDRLSALQAHLEDLTARRAQLDGIIAAVKSTIDAEVRHEKMSDHQKFEALKRQAIEENEKKYGKELRETYGDKEIDDANARVMNVSPAQYDEWKSIGAEIQARLEEAVTQGKAVDGPEGEAIVGLHRRWLTTAGGPYSAAKHRGIAQLYVMDERFAAYYDKAIPGCARFLCDAVQCWAK